MTRRKKRNWFTTTIFTLIVVFFVFICGFLFLYYVWKTPSVFRGLVSTIVNYGLGMTGTALVAAVVAYFMRKPIRKIIKKVTG